MLDSTGARREIIRYSTYGLPFGMASGDVDGSGPVVAGDASAVDAQIGKSFGVSGYTVLLDVDLGGDVNDYAPPMRRSTHATESVSRPRSL